MNGIAGRRYRMTTSAFISRPTRPFGPLDLPTPPPAPRLRRAFAGAYGAAAPTSVGLPAPPTPWLRRGASPTGAYLGM